MRIYFYSFFTGDINELFYTLQMTGGKNHIYDGSLSL